MSAEAAYRCQDCLDLDELIRAQKMSPDSASSFQDDGDMYNLMDFEDHLTRKCHHHDFISSDVQAKWSNKNLNLNFERYDFPIRSL